MLEGTLGTAKYCGFLKYDVLHVLKAKYKRFRSNKKIPHVGKTLMSFFSANCVKLLDWSPYSLDLIGIENIWSILKENLCNLQPFSTKEELWRKIKDVVGNLHIQYPKLFEYLYRRQYENMCDILYNHFIYDMIKKRKDNDELEEI